MASLTNTGEDSVRNMLVEAKNLYKQQLMDLIAPFLVGVFNDMWRKIREDPKLPRGKRLITFQRVLREVPVWNQNVIGKYVDCVLAKVPYLADLISAVFLSYVKVLASVRVHQSKPNIRVKVPSNEAFVHRCLIEAAREFYEGIAEGRQVFESDNKRAKFGVADMAVEQAIRKLLPVSELLKAYIGEEIDDEGMMSPEVDHDEDEGGREDHPAPEPSPWRDDDRGEEHREHRDHEDRRDDDERHEEGHEGDRDGRDEDEDQEDEEELEQTKEIPLSRDSPLLRSPAFGGSRTPPPSPRRDEHVLFSDAEDGEHD